LAVVWRKFLRKKSKEKFLGTILLTIANSFNYNGYKSKLKSKKEKPLKGLAKKKLNHAGGDKYGNKTPLTESSTKQD